MTDDLNCQLIQNCIGDTCNSDTYKLHGYFNRIGIRNSLNNALHMNINNSRVFLCKLPIEQCESDIECIANEITDEIKQNSNDNQVNVIGLCFGGLVGQKIASDNPDLINKLALIHSFSNFKNGSIAINLLNARQLLSENSAKRLNLNGLRKIDNYDFEQMGNQITSKTLVYNCMIDNIIAGDPPKINNAKVINDVLCIHTHIPSSGMNKIESFLNDE